MTLYQNKYRIESIRLKEWDYTNPWWYFVTINTKNHVSYLGEVINGKMVLNSAGKIVIKEWLRTKENRKNIDIDYFVVMPNHIHGIIIINETVETIRRVVSNINLEKNVFVKTTGSIIPNREKVKETIQRIVSTTLQPNSLGSIIGQIKSVCTKQIHSIGYDDFAWQPRFYERIIRNEKELYNIRKYIEENPMRWEFEKNTPENLDI